MSLSDPVLEEQLKALINAIGRGKVVPFLGAGANLCGRPETATWTPNEPTFLPSGAELSTFLAESFECGIEAKTDLSRVCQFIDVYSGLGPLYAELRRLFNHDFRPTAVHRFLAKWPSMMSASRCAARRYQLIVTTNYDDLLEQAFMAEHEPFDVVTYVANGPDRGKFTHLKPNGIAR